ncbi:hypothetical protein V8C86DRAFT_2577320 [Haematococcus lacustris]
MCAQVRKLRTELADKVTELNALQKSTKATQALLQAHNVLLRQGQLLCQVFPPGLSMEELVDMAKQRSVTAGAPEALNFLRNHLSKVRYHRAHPHLACPHTSLLPALTPHSGLPSHLTPSVTASLQPSTPSCLDILAARFVALTVVRVQEAGQEWHVMGVQWRAVTLLLDTARARQVAGQVLSQPWPEGGPGHSGLGVQEFPTGPSSDSRTLG